MGVKKSLVNLFFVFSVGNAALIPTEGMQDCIKNCSVVEKNDTISSVVQCCLECTKRTFWGISDFFVSAGAIFSFWNNGVHPLYERRPSIVAVHELYKSLGWYKNLGDKFYIRSILGTASFALFSVNKIKPRTQGIDIAAASLILPVGIHLIWETGAVFVAWVGGSTLAQRRSALDKLSRKRDSNDGELGALYQRAIDWIEALGSSADSQE